MNKVGGSMNDLDRVKIKQNQTSNKKIMNNLYKQLNRVTSEGLRANSFIKSMFFFNASSTVYKNPLQRGALNSRQDIYAFFRHKCPA